MIDRLADERDYEACYSFGNLVFRGAGTDIFFEQAIPKVYGPEAHMTSIHRIITEEDGTIRALIGLLPCDLHTRFGNIRTGYIGTVSVHPDIRGAGYMKRLMAERTQDARDQGIQLLALGGQRQRYSYYGYAQGGQKWRFEITRRCVRHALRELEAEILTFVKVEAGSQEEKICAELHRKRDIYMDRDWCGFATACRSFVGQAWLCRNAEGSALGWIVSGEDGAGWLTDAAYTDLAALDRMLKAWLTQHDLKSMWLSVPAWEYDTVTHLHGYAESTSLSSAWMLRVLDPAAVIPPLMNLKARHCKLPDGELCMESDGCVFTVRVKDCLCTVTEGGEPELRLSSGQLASLLFDPFPLPEAPKAPAGWFPLPMSFATPDEF